jgi:two-component system response regulator CpxR
MRPLEQLTPEREAILIVDDDREIAQLLEKLLASEGYQTIAVRNGKQALEILQQGTVPSVILLDLMMPVMSGWELVERLERDDTLCQIPVVLMSGHTRLANGGKLRDLHLLPKPFNPQEMLRLVRALARQSSSRWECRPMRVRASDDEE